MAWHQECIPKINKQTPRLQCPGQKVRNNQKILYKALERFLKPYKIMGNGQSIQEWLDSPAVDPPAPPYESKYDPMLGFPNGRKPRVIKTTKQEAESAAVPFDVRDYCLDYYMEFLRCRQDQFPLVYKCKHQVHDYHQCQYDDLVIRMKEFERERRLDKVAKKKMAE